MVLINRHYGQMYTGMETYQINQSMNLFI